jgi:hypothetical protein
MIPKADRRRFRRVRADIQVRPLGTLAHLPPRRAADVSIGGLRAYFDEEQRVGARIQLELVFPDGGSVICKADVVWVKELFADDPAQFEMGVQFVDASPADLDRIAKVLEGPVPE